MIEFWIADLMSKKNKFSIPASTGTWIFEQRTNYDEVLSKMQEGQCANTYFAYNETLTMKTTDTDFDKAIDELIDSCLILSFLQGKCITPSGTTPQSDVAFMQLGDKFIRPRAIAGFSPLSCDQTLDSLFSAGLPAICKDFAARRMELFLSYWISGLTCFTLEDLFLSIGVQMDIVKQCERSATGNKKLSYFKGMESASTRYSLRPLGTDYKDMRNDIIHEGKLSGSNFRNKNKTQCASVIADTLNWIV